MIRCIS